MAKSSTPRSASKKKNDPKKKKQQKKEAGPKAASGKAPAGDRSAPVPKPGTVAPPPPVDLKKPVSVRDLIFQKFPEWKPEETYAPPAPAAAPMEAPPFIAAGSREESARIRALLFRKIDLTAPPPPEPAVLEKKKPVRAPVSIRDLIFKKFPEWKPEETYAPPAPAPAPMEAPPFVAAGSGEESARVRAHLFRKIDLTAPPAPKPTGPEKIETPARLPAVEPEKAETLVQPPAVEPEKVETPVQPPAVEPEKAETPVQPSAVKPAMPVEAPPLPPKEPVTAKPPAPREEPPSRPAEPVKEETPKVTVTYESTEMKGPAPMDKTMKYLIAGFALMVLLVVGASFSNMNAYQIKKLNSGVEIWQGRFAPMGSGPMLALPDAVPPKQAGRVMSKSEIYPYISNYYMQKADDLLKTGGIPDFEQIRAYLDKAFAYANAQSLRNTIARRLASIDLMMLIYKADVSASKGTVQELEAALSHMKKASGLDLDEAQTNLVAQKIENLRKMLEKTATPSPKAGPSK